MPVAIDLSPEEQARYMRSHKWGAAIKAGLIGGALVWLFPGGNPWTAFMRPSGAYIMGRPVSMDQSITMFSAQAIPVHLAHFAVSILCAFIVLAVIFRMRGGKAVLTGVLCGAVLYGVNYLVFHFVAPQFTGSYELNVAMAHVLFGGVTAGAIRGFLRPPQGLDVTQPNPGPDYSRKSAPPDQTPKT